MEKNIQKLLFEQTATAIARDTPYDLKNVMEKSKNIIFG